VRISVIVPVRDDPRIDGLLASLAAQRDAPDFEVLVGLDGGVRTPRVAPGGPPTRIVRLPARGPYAARNAAAHEARGDVLLFTDSDCLCPHDWIAHAASAFEDPAAQVLQGTSDPLASSRVSLWVQDEYERWVAGHAAVSYRRMCNTRCFGVRRETFASRPFPDSYLRGGDGAYGIDLEARGITVRWDPSWRVVHGNPESRLVVGRQLFRQGLDGVRWGRTEGKPADLFGPPPDPSSAGARIHRRATRSRAFAATASAAAACASAVLGLATVALPYSAGRPVFRRFARTAHFAGRLRGEAETR
jgi:glycosyltransferase involved in cell wall biosynthesis